METTRTAADERFFLEAADRVQQGLHHRVAPDIVFAQMRAEAQRFNAALDDATLLTVAANALDARLDPPPGPTQARGHVQNIFTARRAAQDRLLQWLDDPSFRDEAEARAQHVLAPGCPIVAAGCRLLLPEDAEAMRKRCDTMLGRKADGYIDGDRALEAALIELFDCGKGPLIDPLQQALERAGPATERAANDLAESFLAARCYEAMDRAAQLAPDGPIAAHIVATRKAQFDRGLA